MRRDFHFT
jgi:serine/threonine protein kinase